MSVSDKENPRTASAPRKDSDLSQPRLAEITRLMANSQIRGERAVERILDKAIAEARAEKRRETK